ncbi:MAG: D-alanine--D-alanine ligase [Candidatus Falkowbacteria bacterium]|nr:D-alanine--D-alanine ligase [Candidatus Falkowbacteria bacterium]
MKTVALFFGGPSNEHQISIKSAKNIVNNFPYEKYKLVLIYWDKQGVFYIVKNVNKLKEFRRKIQLENFAKIFDLAFLITHGRFGEDGVLQSLLESQKIKYCGCRALSSALCMDKALFKTFLEKRNINQVKFSVLDYSLDSKKDINIKVSKLKNNFKLPVYVKSANSGSSVGITKLNAFSKLNLALKEALKYDNKVIIEEGLVGPREIEVGVLGNKDLLISEPGELQLAKDFYSYDDKYKLGQAKIIIPAKITKNQAKTIKSLAAQVYKLCGCSGFARVDFFVYKNKVFLNEINSLPGFADISMYPVSMMNCGLSYKELLTKIIELAY